jgi:hypothetical protein
MGYKYVTVCNRLIKRQTIPDAVSLSEHVQVTWRIFYSPGLSIDLCALPASGIYV